MNSSKYDFLDQLSNTANIISAGILWLICCLPVVTAGASSSAFYGVLFDIRKGNKTGVKTFFRHFSGCFKNATLLFLAQMLTALPIAFFSYLVFFLPGDGKNNIIECIPIAFLVIIWLAVFCFAYAYTAYFSLNVAGTVKNCFILAFGFPQCTIPVLFLTLIYVAVTVVVPRILLAILPIWIAVMLPLVLWWKSYFLRKVFLNFDNSEKGDGQAD